MMLAICLVQMTPAHADCATRDIRFVANENGTVFDKKTRLMWKRCVQGKTSRNCSSGVPKIYIGADALNAARGEVFAGFENWRLPSIKELQSIVRICSGPPTIDVISFPNTDPARVRSFSSGGDYDTDTWAVDFSDGRALIEDEDIPRQVRLVRDME